MGHITLICVGVIASVIVCIVVSISVCVCVIVCRIDGVIISRRACRRGRIGVHVSVGVCIIIGTATRNITCTVHGTIISIRVISSRVVIGSYSTCRSRVGYDGFCHRN